MYEFCGYVFLKSLKCDKCIWKNCPGFLYFLLLLRQTIQKSQTRKNLNYFKMTRYSQRFKMAKCSNTLKLYILKALIIFFFSSSDMQKIDHLLGCSAIDINSSSNFFFKFFAFSNLICQDFYRLQLKTISSTKKLYWLEKKLKQYAWKKVFWLEKKLKQAWQKYFCKKLLI